MKRGRNAAQRLRAAVELLPRETREAMLRGIERNSIIVGSYTDGKGGICPMLAAHRNGGRTSFASFAKAWDRFAGADRARRATPREVRALRTYLELSLLEDEQGAGSLGEVVEEIRAERRNRAERAAWDLLRTERHDAFTELLEAGAEELSQAPAPSASEPVPA